MHYAYGDPFNPAGRLYDRDKAKVKNIGSADSPRSLCIVSVAVINTPFSRKRMQRKTE